MARPHPSLDGEVPRSFGTDEHLRRDILTTGFEPLPRLPTRLSPRSGRLNDLGVCHPIQWRNRPRFTRGSRIPLVF